MGTRNELNKRFNKSNSKADYYQSPEQETPQDESKAAYYQRGGAQAQPQQAEGETSTQTQGEATTSSQTTETATEKKGVGLKDIAVSKFTPMEQKYAMDGEMVDTYERMARITDPNRPLTPYEQEKLNKQRRREAIFSALGDGLSSLANLYFATKGAKNMLPNETLSGKNKERWDKIQAERNKKDEQYYKNIQRRREERIKREEALKLTPYERERLNIMREENEFNRQYKQAEAERKAKNDTNNYAEKQRYNDARISFMEWKQSNGGKDDGKVVPFRISEDETLDIPSYEYNGVINTLWGMLSKDDQDAVGTTDSKTLQRQPATRNQIIAEVQRRAQTDPAMQKFLRERAKKSSATTPKAEEKPANKPSPTATPKKPSPTK